MASAWHNADLKWVPASSPQWMGKQKAEARGQQNQEGVTASLLQHVDWEGIKEEPGKAAE